MGDYSRRPPSKVYGVIAQPWPVWEINYNADGTSYPLSPRTAERRGSSVTPFLCGLLNATIWSFPFMSNIFSRCPWALCCAKRHMAGQSNTEAAADLQPSHCACCEPPEHCWTCINSNSWLMPSFSLIVCLSNQAENYDLAAGGGFLLHLPLIPETSLEGRHIASLSLPLAMLPPAART